ncbi:bi-domain-containing oxidoreductase [Burkholderiales bacterium]|nr:bi-domain-containing oxidoreductase [Burkholderiales bacterium]
MKQILQSLKTGSVELANIPCPKSSPGKLLIRTRSSLISAGTERMLVDFGKANLLNKARQQPDKVHMVLDKIRSDGLVPTLTAVQNKLDQPLALGYCNVGVVVAVGSGVQGFAIGDRVASNGKHAEVVSVPAILSAKVPDVVPDEAAAFTVIGAIALQGIRLAQPTLGEGFVVIGLGLIGLITVQLLRAHGCRVLGVDFDEAKLELARKFGAITVNPAQGEDVLAAASAFSRSRGVDGVIITASTKSNEPIHQAAQMCRKRGRIVLVGVIGLELSRADFYEKELSFQVSCSYGPGRHDPDYEEKGHDYPLGFVRWTEQRNFEAVLDMLAEGRIDVTPLTSHRFSLTDFQQAYALVGGAGSSLGIVLNYPSDTDKSEVEVTRRTVTLPGAAAKTGAPVMSFIGAGNYAGQVLAPAFRDAGARLKTVASAGGVSGVHVGRKNGFENASTDIDEILSDAETDAVVIATRHNAHAHQVCAALRAGKHVFVEKPLALNREQLEEITSAYEAANAKARRILTVGFNRRFAPQVMRMKGLLETVAEPKSFIVTVNAGAIPPDHWTQDSEVGGGRIIGEACHFVDLLRHLVGHPVTGVQATMIGGGSTETPHADKISFTLRFADGSFGTVHYLANGNKGFPKERIEVFCGGRILQLDNFRKLRGWGWAGFSKMNLWRQDKGNVGCAHAFVEAVASGGEEPIPFEELLEVTRVSLEVVEAASLARPAISLT